MTGQKLGTEGYRKDVAGTPVTINKDQGTKSCLGSGTNSGRHGGDSKTKKLGFVSRTILTLFRKKIILTFW